MEFSPAVIQTATVESFKKAYPLSKSAESTRRKRVFFGKQKMQIANIANVQTMTSLEISEVVKSRHDKVKQSIERLSAKGVITIPAITEVSNPGFGPKTISVYHLDKRSSLIVVAKLSPQHIGDVVDAWGRTQQSLDELISALDAFDVPKECDGMYVYAIRNATTGNIKLGISSDPEQRLKQLQTGNDCRLELVAYRKAENRFQDEARLHHDNSASHIRGEWFTGDASIAIQ